MSLETLERTEALEEVIRTPGLELFDEFNRMGAPDQLIDDVNDIARELNDPCERHSMFFRDLLQTDATPLEAAYLHHPHGGVASKLYIKDETRHEGRAYKLRGIASTLAVLAMHNIRPDFTVMNSAGNHGNEGAIGTRRLNKLMGWDVKPMVFTARDASQVKKDEIRRNGGIVIDESETLADAGVAAREYARLHNGLYIPPFDSKFTMAGQSTTFNEILWQLEADGVDLSKAVVNIHVPKGGGGYVAGTGSQLLELREEGRVGHRVRIVAAAIRDKEKSAFSDGTFTKTGVMTGAIIERLVELGVVREETIEREEVASSMLMTAQALNTRIEPAGAISPASALRAIRNGSTAINVAIASGGQVTDERLQEARDIVAADTDKRYHPSRYGRLVLRGSIINGSRAAASQQIVTPRRLR